MKKVIALDIGGTNFRVALINENFVIEEKNTNSSKIGSKEDFINQAISVIKPFISENIIAISIGVPGRVKSNGYIYALPNMHIFDINLKEILEKEFNMPVYIKNDAEMAALGEKQLGTGKNKNSLYFVTISTGLGGAMCQGNENILSSTEIGHTLFKYHNKNYEYEQLLSGSGIVRLAKLNHLNIANSKELFELKSLNNKNALEIYKDWIKELSNFLNYINELFSPEIIALTGGVMKSKDAFFDDLLTRSKLSIIECQLGQDAGLFGSACYAYNKINKD